MNDFEEEKIEVLETELLELKEQINGIKSDIEDVRSGSDYTHSEVGDIMELLKKKFPDSFNENGNIILND